MRILRKLNPTGRACRPSAALGCIFAYLLAIAGGPAAVAPFSGGMRATAYPCGGHRCGCADAQSCWKHCCCFSVAERLAWASAHNVDPPAGTESLLAAESDEHHERPNCHEPMVRGASRACCHPHKSPEQPTSKSGWQASKCAGITTLWVTAGAALPVMPALEWHPELPPCGCVALRICGRASQADPPPGRPPWDA